LRSLVGDRPGDARQAMTAAGRRHAGRDYAWRGARRIILHSGEIAVRTTPAAGLCVRVCTFVTSGGSGGTGGFGGTVPLGDGRGRVATGPGSGWGVRLVRAWCLPLAGGGPPQHLWLPLVSGRPERCDGECEVCGRWPTPSRAGVSCRRPRPGAAALALALRQAPPGAGKLNRLRRPCRCPVAGWPAAAPGRVRAGRPAAMTSLAFIVSPPPRAGILARQLRSGTGAAGRDAALRASWSAAIVMTAPMRMSSSGSPGKWAAGGG
jgi:hypothetical protein